MPMRRNELQLSSVIGLYVIASAPVSANLGNAVPVLGITWDNQGVQVWDKWHLNWGT